MSVEEEEEEEANKGVITWEELKKLIANNDILHLRRHPDVTTRYSLSKQQLKDANMTLFSHLIINELQWAPTSVLKQVNDINDLPKVVTIVPKDPRLLGNADDIKILLNDFPYYFEPNVTHLVVWTKVNIKSDPNSSVGDISNYTRQIIDRYVEKTFINWLNIPQENVIWFRNWSALQSVRNISHIHVIVKNFPQEQMPNVQRKSGIPLAFDAEDGDLNVDEYITTTKKPDVI